MIKFVAYTTLPNGNLMVLSHTFQFELPSSSWMSDCSEALSSTRSACAFYLAASTIASTYLQSVEKFFYCKRRLSKLLLDIEDRAEY